LFRNTAWEGRPQELPLILMNIKFKKCYTDVVHLIILETGLLNIVW